MTRNIKHVTVYLSGPMTGLVDYNYPAFHTARDALRAAGYDVISPARGMVEGWNWSDYMRRGLRDVCDADVVAVLPGWEQSKGAQLEVLCAQALGMRVEPLEVWL